MIKEIKQFIEDVYGKKVFFFLPLALVLVLVLMWLTSLFFGPVLPESSKVLNSGSGIMGGGTYDITESQRDEVGYAPSIMPPTVPGKGYVVTQTVDRKIIRNASVDILVKKVEDTVTKIQEIADNHSGLVDDSNVSNRGADTKYGVMTIRVPNSEFNSAIEEIKKLAVKVNTEDISSSDVTAQYVDLEARLKSKKAVEEQYMALLQKADEVDEIISVSTYLNAVREEIEVLQAQRNYLSGQVAMSSITVTMNSEAEVKILGITWYPVTVIKQAFRSLLIDLTGIVNWLINFVFALPGLLIKFGIFVSIFWAVFKIVKNIYKKFEKDNFPAEKNS